MTFTEAIADFDNVRWSVACREMQVRILNGNIEAAIYVLRKFAIATAVTHVTMDSHVVEAFPMRIALVLEKLGCTTIRSAEKITDVTLLDVPNVSKKSVELIRRTIREVKAGVAPTIVKDEDCLIEPEFIATLEHQIFMVVITDGPQFIGSLVKLLKRTQLEIEDAFQRSTRLKKVGSTIVARTVNS